MIYTVHCPVPYCLNRSQPICSILFTVQSFTASIDHSLYTVHCHPHPLDCGPAEVTSPRTDLSKQPSHMALCQLSVITCSPMQPHVLYTCEPVCTHCCLVPAHKHKVATVISLRNTSLGNSCKYLRKIFSHFFFFYRCTHGCNFIRKHFACNWIGKFGAPDVMHGWPMYQGRWDAKV